MFEQIAPVPGLVRGGWALTTSRQAGRGLVCVRMCVPTADHPMTPDAMSSCITTASHA
jgi:hypothetical protein